MLPNPELIPLGTNLTQPSLFVAATAASIENNVQLLNPCHLRTPATNEQSSDGELLLRRLPLGLALDQMADIADRKRIREIDGCQHLRQEDPPVVTFSITNSPINI